MNPQAVSRMTVVNIANLVLALVATNTRAIAETEESPRYLSSAIHKSIGVNGLDSNLLQDPLSVDDQSRSKDPSTACCDGCLCTRSIPPKCQCEDIKPQCHAKCKLCRCAMSQPPKCKCLDVPSFCYPKCSSSSAAITDE